MIETYLVSCFVNEKPSVIEYTESNDLKDWAPYSTLILINSLYNENIQRNSRIKYIDIRVHLIKQNNVAHGIKNFILITLDLKSFQQLNENFGENSENGVGFSLCLSSQCWCFILMKYSVY